MKKTMKFIVLFMVLLVSTSAYNGGKIFSAEEGYKAPLFSLSKNEKTISLSDYKGRYVLLTFWASSDAASRMACREYDEMTRNIDEGQICHLAVNFDRSERLFREIVRRDNLNEETQYYAAGTDASRLIDDYRLTGGFNTFLINPEGEVVALNPTTESLNDYLRN